MPDDFSILNLNLLQAYHLCCPIKRTELPRVFKGVHFFTIASLSYQPYPADKFPFTSILIKNRRPAERLSNHFTIASPRAFSFKAFQPCCIHFFDINTTHSTCFVPGKLSNGLTDTTS